MKKIPLKPFVFLICLAPFAYYLVGAFLGWLGVNPIETMMRGLGDWALRFLLLILALTTVQRALKWNRLAGYRRMIGLFGFFYVFTHLAVYVGLDHFFDWQVIWKDIVKRPYITIGMAAFVLLIPLAVTSLKRIMRQMGGKSWKRLHKLIYPIAIMGVAHFFLLVKADVREPLVYGGILFVLLAERLYRALKKPARNRARGKDRLVPGE